MFTKTKSVSRNIALFVSGHGGCEQGGSRSLSMGGPGKVASSGLSMFTGSSRVGLFIYLGKNLLFNRQGCRCVSLPGICSAGIVPRASNTEGFVFEQWSKISRGGGGAGPSQREKGGGRSAVSSMRAHTSILALVWQNVFISCFQTVSSPTTPST